MAEGPEDAGYEHAEHAEDAEAPEDAGYEHAEHAEDAEGPEDAGYEHAEDAEGAEGPEDAEHAAGGPPQLVELGLSEVRSSVLLRPGQEAGLVVLAEMQEPFRALHIYVGQPEAKAIQAGWHGGRAARPGTWDLLLQAVELLGARLDQVVIDRVEEGRHFFATLALERAGQILSLPCRPSDAVALAVRVPATGIYATEEVMAAAGQYP
jgi:bifunctional DNase/RNase